MIAVTGAPAELLSLRPGVYAATGSDGRRYLLAGRTGQQIGRATRGQQRLLARLAAGPATADELQAVADGEPVAELLAQWRAGGWLAVTVGCRDRRRYTVRPFRRPTPPPDWPPPERLVLSRFAVIRREEPDLVVESPLAWCDIQLHDPALLASVLAGGSGATGTTGATGATGDDLADRLARDLWWAGMLVPPAAERQLLATRQWYPHELWFHHRSRGGDRHAVGDGYGGTYWLGDEFDPPPADPPPLPGPTVALPRPDPTRLRSTDPPLAAVVQDRRSVRRSDEDAPLSVAQLGELLFRCARTIDRRRDDPVPVRRPYPVGGGLYDLDLYPVAHRVTGLSPGMYRYDPDGHRLAQVCAPNRATRSLLEGGREAADLPALPQLLLVLSYRFARTMYKYQQLSYALVLKNVGVFYHQLYLAATAMGLAPCALGSGNPDAFAEATGHDPLTESSVGEFVLGSGPPRQPGAGTPAG